MQKLKTPSEIEKMKKGGALLSKALKAAAEAARPGVRISELNEIAEKIIREGGGKPSFLNYRISPEAAAFPSSLCVSVDDEVIHGFGDRDLILGEGAIVSLDLGLWFEGLATDMAVTVPVGKISSEKQALLHDTKIALEKALQVIKAGVPVRKIGQTVETYLAPKGYGIVRDFVGHGVGHDVHELPNIPNFDDGGLDKTKLEIGMTIALEPMVIIGGDGRIDVLDDGWTVVSRSGQPSAHFEVTVAVTRAGYELLTPWVK
ncbi:MAG: type I methionyl aminopeptidase [bacterium]